MLVRENADTIGDLANKLFDFVGQDSAIQGDLGEYLKTIGATGLPQSRLQTLLIPYIFERRLGEKRESVFEIFESKNKDLSIVEKEVLEGLKNSVSSVFKINKVLKNGFELFNLVNEISCTALCLVKMSNFRGVASGQYLYGRIFQFKDSYYLFEINEIVPFSRKEDVLKYAVSKQVQDSSLLYENNPVKLKEIEKIVEDTGKKFKEFFKTDEIIALSPHVDDLISYFNDFAEEGKTCNEQDIQRLTTLPEKYGYFEVKELMDNSGDFLETAAKGFSSHEIPYDVGIIYDNQIGLLVIPFYGTFKEIFTAKDPSNVEGYKDCILNFLKSPRIPDSVFKKVYEADKNRFLEIINNVLEQAYEFDNLMQEFKNEYLLRKRFSSTTVLYASKAFNELMGFVEKDEQKTQETGKIGRNDLCPCGSGKKYKKCCLK